MTRMAGRIPAQDNRATPWIARGRTSPGPPSHRAPPAQSVANMPLTLQYRRADRRRLPLAGGSLLCSLFSGPVSLAFAVAAVMAGAQPLTWLLITLLPLVAAFIFSCYGHSRLVARGGSPRHRFWANLALFVPIAWALLIVLGCLLVPRYR